MAKIQKLTPRILKTIISEEKERIKKQIKESRAKKRNSQSKKDIDRIQKLKEEQVKLIKKYRMLQEAKKLIKRKLNKRL